MIVIFGNGKKEFKEAEGKFYCPKCKFMKIYNVKTIKDYFQLFFYPFFQSVKNQSLLLNARIVKTFGI